MIWSHLLSKEAPDIVGNLRAEAVVQTESRLDCSHISLEKILEHSTSFLEEMCILGATFLSTLQKDRKLTEGKNKIFMVIIVPLTNFVSHLDHSFA